MNKNEFWLEVEDQVNRCEDCPHPNGCIRECVLDKHVYEDVAKIRGEK
jgi:hypothetical protein